MYQMEKRRLENSELYILLSHHIDLACRSYLTEHTKCKNGVKPSLEFIRCGRNHS